jgi:glycosyltransferase involved in cell wall biosynthesis
MKSGADVREPSNAQVLLATYNGSEYLQAQLESLFRQTDQAFEVLAADDGSTDDTLGILHSTERLHPGRFTVIATNRVGGPANNFYRLLRASSSPWIMLCDQDDVWHESKVAAMLAQARHLEASAPGRPLLVHHDLEVVDESLATLHPSMFAYSHLAPLRVDFRSLILRNCITGCASAMNRALIDLVLKGGAAEMMMHDWWIALTAAAFGEIHTMPTSLVKYRQHAKNSLGAARWTWGRAAGRAAKVMGGAAVNRPLTLCGRQAGSFLKVYGSSIHRGQADALHLASELACARGLRRRLILLRLGVLSHGLRGVVELAAG